MNFLYNFNEFSGDPTSIFQQIKPRVKSFTSVRAKCLSKHFLVLKFTVENKFKLLISIAVLLVSLTNKFRIRQTSEKRSLLKLVIDE